MQMSKGTVCAGLHKLRVVWAQDLGPMSQLRKAWCAFMPCGGRWDPVGVCICHYMAFQFHLERASLGVCTGPGVWLTGRAILGMWIHG